MSDSVDVYPFRRINGRAQFLVLLRRPEVVLGNTWHAIHTKVTESEKAFEAARRGVRQTTGMMATHLYSADLVSQFYDHYSDGISLAPVFAALLEGPGPVILAPDFSDFAWCDLEEAVVRLLSSSQRWAVRHIAHIIADGGPEAEYYRIE